MIYPRLLKTDFEKLPRALREFHSSSGERWANGKVAIRHDLPWLARLVGFPAAGDDIPMRLHVVAEENQETWTRWFGDSARRSVQWARDGLLVEKVGPVRVHFHVFANETGMRFESRAARLWGFPLPMRMEAWERGGDSSWEFEVTVAHIGSYRGMVAAS